MPGVHKIVDWMYASSLFFALHIVYVIQLQLLLSGDLRAHTSHHGVRIQNKYD